MAGVKKKGVRSERQCRSTAAESDSTVGVSTRSMTRMNINKLNDDCILEIFSYLSYCQLIGIERVCKKWKELTLRMWAKVSVLNYDIITEITNDNTQINLIRLEKILLKCGDHVKTLTLDCTDLYGTSYYPRRCETDKIVCLISKYCKHLRNISLRCGRPLNEKGFSVIENKILTDNLESLELPYVPLLDEKALERILKKGVNINQLIIHPNDGVTGESLVNCGRSFKKLGVESYSSKIDISTLEKVLEISPKLELLYGIKACIYKMFHCFSLREHLVEMNIRCTKFFKDFPESPLPFPKLRFLNLNGDQSVSNNILSKFDVLFPNLESVDLTECDYKPADEDDGKTLNNDGIKELSKLPKLKALNLNGLHFLKAEALVHLAANANGRIESLGSYWCNKLRDPGMILFVSLCPKLTYLDVSYGQRITDNLLDGVLELLPLRTSKKPLKVRITSSGYCIISRYNGVHPMLEVEDHGELDEAHFDYDESEGDENEWVYSEDESDV